MWLLTGEMQFVLFEPSRPRKVALGIPLDEVLFPLRERGWVGACTDLNCLCYNSSQSMDRCSGVAIACGRFLAVFHTVHLLSISYRKLFIFGGTD